METLKQIISALTFFLVVIAALFWGEGLTVLGYKFVACLLFAAVFNLLILNVCKSK